MSAFNFYVALYQIFILMPARVSYRWKCY